MRLAIFGCVALMGCVPGTEPESTAQDASDCGAARYADLIGEPVGNHKFETADAPVRIIYPDMAVTQDFNPMRLNVDVNINGDIARLWCG